MERTSTKKTNNPGKRRDQKLTIYSKSLITKNVHVSINNVGKSIRSTLERVIAMQIEGKCIVEGFVKPNSVKIITQSSGKVKGVYVLFECVFECDTCCPVEGMVIQCIAKNITKAGIRAESVNDSPSPVVVFVTRDHHYSMPYFSEIEEGDNISVKVIGQRFELNDKYVSIIAELIDPNSRGDSKKKNTIVKKPRLVLGDSSEDKDAGKGLEDFKNITTVVDSSDHED